MRLNRIYAVNRGGTGSGKCPWGDQLKNQLKEQPAISGKDINLTIDINLQSYATSILKRGRNKPISLK